MICGNVSDCVAIGYDVSLETPLAPQLVLQQIFVCACRLPIDRVVGAHHRSSLSFDDSGAECGLIGVHLVVLADVHIGEVTRGLRPAMHGVVLRCRDGEIVLRVVALQSRYVSDPHLPGQKGIFTIGLLSPPPAWIAKDVEIGRPEIEPSHDAGVPLARVLHVLDAALDANLPSHGANTRQVEGGGKPYWFRILRDALVDHAVKGLAPPLVRRDL